MRRATTLFARPFQEGMCQNKEFTRAFAATILNKDIDKNPAKNIAELFGQLFRIKMLIAVSEGFDNYYIKVDSRNRAIKDAQEDTIKFNGWGCGI